MLSVWGLEAKMIRAWPLQVWTNCRLYNAEGSDISRACKRLEKHALTAWKADELPRKRGAFGEHTAGAPLKILWIRLEEEGASCMAQFWEHKYRLCEVI